MTFDLEKVRSLCDSLPHGDLDYHISIDRISKGTTKEVQLHLKTVGNMANMLPTALDRIAELEADLEQSEIVVEARLEVIDQQAAKIRELEGKIGTSDQFPDTTKLIWQITEERKNALRFSISGEMSQTCSCKYCKDAIATIRAMLQEAE
jgi:hypothetical protein